MKHTGKHTLNIIVSRTVTRIGSLIRSVTGGEYNHCSFYVDEDVRNIYGFSRRYREFWFTGCFTRENAVYYEDYRVYSLPLRDEQFAALDQRLTEMKAHTKVYNYLSALMLPAGIAVESDNSFICSTFAADLIDRYTDVSPVKDVNLHGPMDIYELLESAVCKGKAEPVRIDLPREEEYSLTNPVTRWHGSVIDVGGCDAGNVYDSGSGCGVGNGYDSGSGCGSKRGCGVEDGFDAESGCASKSGCSTESGCGAGNRYDSGSGYGSNSGCGAEDGFDAEIGCGSKSGCSTESGCGRIVCEGGDREFSRCVDEMLRSGINTPVALIPTGTTNDLARTVGIPTDREAARQIASGSSARAVDSGTLDGRNFICIAGFGDVTHASHSTSRKAKDAIGYAAYVLSGLQSLMHMHDYDISISIDGRPLRDRYLMMLVTNSHRAGGIRLWDQISPDDGVFEVLLVRRTGPKDVHETIEKYSAKNILITNHSSEPIEWILDGEPGGSTAPNETSEIRVHPRSYRVIVG